MLALLTQIMQSDTPPAVQFAWFARPLTYTVQYVLSTLLETDSWLQFFFAEMGYTDLPKDIL